MFIELLKDFGDKIALVKTAEHEAVLVLVERIEKEGPFFKHEGVSHQYPIIKFERPPELCGVQEPVDPKVHQRLHKAFISALIVACKSNSINLVYCSGISSPNAGPYRRDLALVGIRLGEHGS